MVTKSFRVYGVNGHRQKISFNPSAVYDWSKDGKARIVELQNADKTGTNEYTRIIITRDTEAEVESELTGQISDGLFENVRVGKITQE